MNTNLEHNTSGQAGQIDNESATTLQRIHDDISRMKTSDNVIGGEMNKIRLVCDPPPPSPRCHVEYLPPNPVTVEKSMIDMQVNNSMLQIDLGLLGNDIKKGGSNAIKDFAELNQQFQMLRDEIKELDKLIRVDGKTIPKYDKEAITNETESIDSITRLMERTRKRIEREWGAEK